MTTARLPDGYELWCATCGRLVAPRALPPRRHGSIDVVCPRCKRSLGEWLPAAGLTYPPRKIRVRPTA